MLNEARLLDERHKSYADSVMNIYAKANRTVVQKVKEDDESMCEAINELFADETRAERERADREGKRADEALAERDRIQHELDEIKQQLQEALAENARLKAAAQG